MTIALHLDPATEATLRRQIQGLDVPLPEFGRDVIGEPLFGRYASGDTDHSVRCKEVLRDRFRDRHRR